MVLDSAERPAHSSSMVISQSAAIDLFQRLRTPIGGEKGDVRAPYFDRLFGGAIENRLDTARAPFARSYGRGR